MGLDVERGPAPQRDGRGVDRRRRPARTSRRRCRRPAAGCRPAPTRWRSGTPARGPACRRGRRRPAPRGAGRAARWPGPGRPRPARGGSGSTTPALAVRRGRLPAASTRSTPVDLEAQLGPHPPQQADVARPAVAEVEVLAHHHLPGPQAARQHLADEVLGRLPAAGLVEGDHQAVVDAGVGQQLQLLVEVGEQAGRRLGPHHRRRVAVEGDHRGGQPPLVGPPAHLGDDRPVPQVDAVVGADGDRGARGRAGAGGQVAEHLHRARSVPVGTG